MQYVQGQKHVIVSSDLGVKHPVGASIEEDPYRAEILIYVLVFVVKVFTALTPTHGGQNLCFRGRAKIS